MNTDITITRTFTDGRPPQVMKFQPQIETDVTPEITIQTSPSALDAMNFAALLFCVPMQEPGYDAWAAVERLGLSRHFVDVTPPVEKRIAEPLIYSDGDNCPFCTGKFHYPPVNGCSCHIAPPCDACVNNRLECDQCGNTDIMKRSHEVITPEEVGSIDQSLIFAVPHIPAPDIMKPHDLDSRALEQMKNGEPEA